MKRIDIINIYRVLNKVKLNKVNIKALRNTLISNHFKMHKVAKENDEYINSLRDMFDPEAVKDVNEAYQKYAEEVVDIDLAKIDRNDFADIIAGGDIEFTLADMAVLEPIFK